MPQAAYHTLEVLSTLTDMDAVSASAWRGLRLLELRAWGLGFGVWGLGIGVSGLGFRV